MPLRRADGTRIGVEPRGVAGARAGGAVTAGRHVALAVVAAPLVLLAAAALTGRTRRAYPVLAPSDIVTLAGQPVRVADLAARHQPRMFLPPAAVSPPLLWVWYEAVPVADAISLVYYHAWETETNPNPTIHRLYSVFRAAYYGYPLYDIEYFQVDVSTADGQVERLRFESGTIDDYAAALSEHLVVRVKRHPDGAYRVWREGRAGAAMPPGEPATVRFDGRRVLVAVQTWNHLSRLLTDADTAHVRVADAPLRELTEEAYGRFKFARKSQGDHQTPESAWTRPVAVMAAFVFVGIPVWVMRRAGQRDAG